MVSYQGVTIVRQATCFIGKIVFVAAAAALGAYIRTEWRKTHDLAEHNTPCPEQMFAALTGPFDKSIWFY